MQRSTLFRAHHADLGQEVNALRLFHVTRILRMGGAWLSAVPLLLALLLAISPGIVRAADQPLRLQDLIDECLKSSPELRAFESRVEAAKYRVPQAKSLPDPMFMFGYQNEGFQSFTLGQEIGAMGMFGLSQMFFFPGKRSLKEE
ncbi:MAG: TolC family protein, partial [Syntrophorhabdales bacterium]